MTVEEDNRSVFFVSRTHHCGGVSWALVRATNRGRGSQTSDTEHERCTQLPAEVHSTQDVGWPGQQSLVVFHALDCSFVR